MTRRTPTGAAVLQPEVTRSITEAVLDELAEQGHARLSMESVAKRAGVGKSALYRRWPSKHDMVLAVISEFSVGLAVSPNTGSLREDVRATLTAIVGWLTHPRFSRILPDMIAEGARNPAMYEVFDAAIGAPRRAQGEAMLRRAIDREELPADLDMEIALDLLAAPIYWRFMVRGAGQPPEYLDSLTDMLLRALGAKV